MPFYQIKFLHDDTVRKCIRSHHAPHLGIIHPAHTLYFFGLQFKFLCFPIQPKVDAIQAKQKEEYEKEQKALNGGESADEAVIDMDPKEEITFDDFAKMQFQVGEILSCEAVAKSKKLLCSQVKIGNTVKQIVSGIRKDYTPEEMVGKKVMVLVNLKPAKLAGVLSEGMLLCAEDENGTLSLMTPEKPMPSGAEIC